MTETSAGKPQPEPIPLKTEVRHEFFSFFLPHFPAPKSERLLPPRRAGALSEGPVPFVIGVIDDVARWAGDGGQVSSQIQIVGRRLRDAAGPALIDVDVAGRSS